MSSPDPRIETIFHEALTGAPAEREAFVTKACAGDEALRAEVQRLLAAHEEAGTYFERPNSPEIEAELARLKPEEVGERIGPYKLMEQIGEGGFGTVWVADQEQPVRRRVALKIIKLGMDTKEVIARFEQERQALAMMDHPHIAKVLDAGATQWGRPYFVMELVRGVKITDYCDDQRLSTRERIELFITVCQAVQHAHQKGIIHRDLKPSNILVTINDGKAVPKVIDFGVAKATQGRLTDQTIYTQFQQMIGTPLYMSPEQAEPTSLDIDTRSDIYALGVLLYELLTGHTPIEQNTLARLGMDELRRIIREVDPPRPSLRMKTLDGAELTTVAKRRSTEPAKLPGALRGNLDWIVMNCIEKDRARRYDTANGLAMDLQRHLKNEVVVARPPTTAYLLSKLIRRNKLAFAAGAAIVVSLVAGIAATAWQLAHTREAEQRAVAALDELRATAPAFVEQARGLAARERFDEAIEKLDYALKLRPDAAEFLVAKGDLLQCQFQLAKAAAIYREALRVKPGLTRAEASAKLCDELLAAPLSDQGELTRESLARLHLAMQHQQRPAAELMPVARLLGEEKKLIIEYWLARLNHLPFSADSPLTKRLAVREDGLLALDLSGVKIADLAPLAGMPLGSLNLTDCDHITDFGPVRDFHSLTSLQLNNTTITDLSPLIGLPLEVLSLTGTQIFDLAPLRGMKLKRITLRYTRVSDLRPLADMPLNYIDATSIPVVDYSPLSGAPLEECIIQNSPLNDLTFLRNSSVKELTLFGCKQARGFAVLAGLKSLNLLILPENFRDFPDVELAAIGALRTHPTLRNIQSEPRSGAGWIISTTRSKEEFWRKWDSEMACLVALREAGVKFTANFQEDHSLSLTINDTAFSNTAIFSGHNISRLNLAKTAVADLAPLTGLPLKFLDISETRVTDIAPLGNLSLYELRLNKIAVTDLSALRREPLCRSLAKLWLRGIQATDFSPLSACTALDSVDLSATAIQDLEPLRNCRLRYLYVSVSRIRSVSPVAGMPLEQIFLTDCAVTDLSPLLDCPTLKDILLPKTAQNLDALLALPNLSRISYTYDGKIRGPSMKVAEFWAKRGGPGFNVVQILSDESKRKPEDTILALRVAALQVWTGKDDDHAATSQRMLQWAANTTDPQTASRVAKLVCLRPVPAKPVQEATLALARNAVKLGKGKSNAPWCQLTLGMAEYRSGHFREAGRSLEDAANNIASADWGEYRAYIEGTSGFYRAMSLFQEGHKEEARTLFATIKEKTKLPPDDGTIPYSEHHDQVIVWLAYKEATKLLWPEGHAVKLLEDAIVESRNAKGSSASETILAMRRLAEFHDAAGRMDEALRVMTDASIGAPQDFLLAIEVAALQAWVGTPEDYLSICRRTFENAKTATDDVVRALRIAARAACLLPHSDSELRQQALDWARIAASTPNAPPVSRLVIGMAYFRSGDDSEAEQALAAAERESADTIYRGPAMLFRAMILARRGDTPEALKLFSEAKLLMKPLPQEKHGVLRNKSIRDDLQFWLAYEEAEALLQTK